MACSYELKVVAGFAIRHRHFLRTKCLQNLKDLASGTSIEVRLASDHILGHQGEIDSFVFLGPYAPQMADLATCSSP